MGNRTCTNTGSAPNAAVTHYTPDALNQYGEIATALATGAPALSIEYTYDWRSRKIREKVTEGSTVTHDQRILYDHWNPVADFTIRHSSFVIQNSLLWAPDLSGAVQGAGGVGGLLTIHDPQSTIYHPSYDTNGNIIAWSDSTGKLVHRLDYDPFGLREIQVGRCSIYIHYGHLSSKKKKIQKGIHQFFKVWGKKVKVGQKYRKTFKCGNQVSLP